MKTRKKNNVALKTWLTIFVIFRKKRTLFEDDFAQKPGQVLFATLSGEALTFSHAKHFSA